MNIDHKRNIYTENATAIFVILAVSFFILANFAIGFSLPIYLLAMLVGFGLAAIFPRSGVYAIVFLTVVFERFFTLMPIYWNRAEYKIYPLDILFIGVILGTVFQYIASKEKNKFRVVDWLIAIFILAGAIYFFISAYFLHADQSIAFSTFKNYAFYGLFYFVIVFLFGDKDKLFRLLKFFLAGAAVITIFIIIGAIRGEGLWTEFTPLSTPGTRILAFPHAFYLTMAVLTAFVCLVFEKSKKYNFLYALIPVWMIGIVGSLMRHLWISLFVSLIFLLLILPKENRSRLKKIIFHYVFAGIIFAVLLSYLAFLFPSTGFSKSFSSVTGIAGQRFASTVQVSSDESLNWRRNVWQSAWHEFKATPFFGIGYGKKLSVEIGTKYRDFVEVRNIHNSLLTVFIQMGIWSAGLAFAAFWLLAKPVYLKFKKTRYKLIVGDREFLQIVIVVLFVNYLVAFLFQTYLETNLLGIFFWIILGALRILTSNVRSAQHSMLGENP